MKLKFNILHAFNAIIWLALLVLFVINVNKMPEKSDRIIIILISVFAFNYHALNI